MGADAVLMIAVTEAKRAAEKETTLEGRLKVAMNATKDHWMVTDAEEQFRAAIGAVLLLSEGEDKDRIMLEMKQLRILGAMANGVPVDFEQIKPLENPIGLTKLWKNIKGAR